MSARISSADAELIHSLESAFARHAGRDGLIELPELQRVLGLKNEGVARRVLRAFDTAALPLDRGASGLVDSHAFLNAVRALISGGERERLEFAFRLYADDADGSISEPELLRMIAISAAESSKVARASQPPDQLAKALFRAADADRDGRLSFDEFAGAMRKHPELLRRITRSEALGIAPNEALLQRLAAPPPQPVADGLLRALDNHRYDLLALAAWLALNLVVFSYSLGQYQPISDPPGSGWERLAHAFAACLGLNAAFVFLPLMRHVIAHLRQTWWGQKLDIDRAVQAHRVLGHIILGLAWAHAIAYALAFESGHHALGVGHLLTRTYPGTTGVLLLLAFSALWAVASVAFLRTRRAGHLDSSYRLYACLFVLIVIHAPGFLVWAALPMLALVFELVSRRRKRSRQALVHELTPLRAGVTRIVIERPAAFEFEAGNYVFIKLPNIAKHVWHPFTLSSPPEQSELTLHAQNRDEWTATLRAAAEARAKRSYKSSLSAHIDGPHGAPSAHVFHTRNVVLIGAGAGITPLASILASIVARTSKSATSSSDCELQNVELFWLNRDPYAYEWFGAQLGELMQRPVQIRIGAHCCVTGGGTGSTSAALDIARQLQHRPVGLRTTAHAGHPDWRIVLTAIADQHAPEPVEVFFCGPPGLGVKLRDHCAHIGLRFHEEKF